MRYPISFSALARLEECPGSYWRPRAPYVANWATDYGTRQHGLLENYVATRATDREEGDIDVTSIPVEGFESEVALAIEVATGNVFKLKLSGPRDYRGIDASRFIVGTADLWKPGAVSELKTGNPDYIKPPLEHIQLLAQAYTARYRRSATTATIHVRRKNGQSVDLTAKIDRYAHAATMARLRAIHAAVKERRPVTPTQSACHWCPAICTSRWKPAEPELVQIRMVS